MQPKRPLTRLLGSSALALAICLGASGAALAFEPQVGQPGKDVVWVPTAQTLVDRMLDTAKATPADYVIDLGSGDGRTVITAAKRGIRALGIEYNPDMVELARRNAEKEGVADRATFTRADLFETDFSKATVLTLFLLPDINLRLRPAILDMRPGTRVVSNTFTMGDWAADETIEVSEGCQSYCRAYYWVVPAKVAGSWTSQAGDLSLEQKYQRLTGTMATPGGSVPIVDGRMRGEEISFRAGDAEFTGRVEGGAIRGVSRSGGKDVPWQAARR